MIDALGIAILNRPDLLMRCLKSIDYSVGYLVIINNGSLDAVPAMVDRIVKENPRFQEHSVFNPGGNLGVAGAWNMIQHHAFADPNRNNVLICGNDIQWMPRDLELIDNTIRDYPNADFVFGNHSYSNFLVKRSGWEKIGAFDENLEMAYLEDSDHWQRILRTPGIMNGPALGVQARHDQSSTINSSPDVKNMVQAQHRKNWKYYSDKWDCPEWSNGMENAKTPFDEGGPVNRWSLGEDRLKRIHFFKSNPMCE